VKQFKSTGILFALVMIVVGYAYFIEYKGKLQKDAAETEAKKIIPFSLDDLTEFSVKTFAEEYLFKKVKTDKNFSWVLEKPVSDAVNLASVQGFLSQFGQELYDDVVAEGPTIEYNIYGLNSDDPKARITEITFKKDDQVLTIEIGSATAIGGKKYLRINKQDKVLLAGYFWEAQFQKSLSDLREKNFVPQDFVIEKIEIQNKDHMIFEQKNGKWILNELSTNDPDQSAIDDIYYQVKNLKATQIFKEGKNPTDISYLGLADPELKINIYSGPKKLEMLFSKNMGGQIYATTSDRNVIFSVNLPAMNVFRKGIEDFRDKKKPLNFNLADVGQIDFRSSLTSFKLKKQDQTWVSQEKLQGMEVDNSKVVDILSKLSQMKVKRFFDQEVPYQKSGMTELELKNQKGDKILELQWSGRPVEDVFVTKSNLQEKTFGLSMQDISSLPFQSVLVEPKKPLTEKLTQ
jgi:hypothetical protein